jgi:O-antigen/teichoic acid export membrane protein
MSATDDTLIRRMLGGGAVLAVRQLAGAAIGVGGLVMITGLIGAAEFGRYAAAAAIVALLWLMVPTAIVGALVRRPAEPDRDAWSGAVLLLAGCGAVAPVVAWLAGLAVQHWGHLDGVALAAAALMSTSLLTWPAQSAVALLERRLDYLAIARADILGQLTFVALGSALAWAGWGAWALVVAGMCHHLLASALVLRAARGLPAAAGRPDQARRLAGEALAMAAVSASWHARPLIAPLVVGWACGPAAVGQVALAARVVEVLSAARGAATRVATAALPRIAGDHVAMSATLRRASTVSAWATAAPLAAAAVAIALLAAWIPQDWLASGSAFPGLAAFSIVAGLLAPCSAALVVTGGWRGLVLMHVTMLAVIAAAALLLVPRYGALGYALAECAAAPVLAWTWWRCARSVARPVTSAAVVGAVAGIVIATLPWWRAGPPAA